MRSNLEVRLLRRHVLLAPLVLALIACGDVGTAPASRDAASSSSSSGNNSPAPTPVSSTRNGLAGQTFWVDPLSNARATADAWRVARPDDARQMEKIASQPVARWFGNWNSDVRSAVDAAVSTMSLNGGMPLLVAYNIPQRDCGGLSGGNNVDAASYRSWIAAFASGLAGRKAAIILEPDALANMDCLGASGQQTRLELLRYAVGILRANGNVAVYVDAGHAHWQPAATMAQRLTAAGVGDAAGFSLNVSNFVSTHDNVDYGNALSALVGGKHYVIDTGRNGLGETTDAQWCNPSGRAIGERPSVVTGVAALDAYLWVKPPGESDGTCNGGSVSG